MKKIKAKWILGVLVGAVIIMGLLMIVGSSGKSQAKIADPGIYEVRRSDLVIKVVESGDIGAVNSVDVYSKVDRRTTIVNIVDEGTVITPADVNSGLVLVELDSSEIEQRLTEQKIRYLSDEAQLAEAKEAYDIQIKQNESDIQAGALKVKFALMDLQKYLGADLADMVIHESNDPNAVSSKIVTLVKHEQLGGEALQKLRQFEEDINLKEQQLELAKNKYEWTLKLDEKKYVSQNEVEADRLDMEQKQIGLEQAKTAKDLFVAYEFPKEAEKLLSDYKEAIRELERIKAKARSRLAQAKAKLEGNKAGFEVQTRRVKQLEEQFAACTIKAPAPGQVVYWSSRDRWRSRNQPIKVGAEVYERMNIISIPDTSAMKVELKIHETWINKVEVGQKANISVSAFPDDKFTGVVIKKNSMAEPPEFFNPDLKVYAVDVKIDGTHEALQTGMTGKVEIIIEELKDVISVPIQSVINVEGRKICYVLEGGKPRKTEVQTGSFNEDFVEITSGLDVGEQVLLNPPRATETLYNK